MGQVFVFSSLIAQYFLFLGKLPSWAYFSFAFAILFLANFILNFCIFRLLWKFQFQKIWKYLLLSTLFVEISCIASWFLYMQLLFSLRTIIDALAPVIQLWGMIGYFVIILLGGIVFFTIPLYIFFFFLFRFLSKRELIKSTKKIEKNTVTTSLTVAFISQILFVGLVFFLVIVGETCSRNISSNFDLFNAHLKDVCDERTNKAECPRNEYDLRQFWPQKYDEMTSCSMTFYEFDSKTQEHTLLVRFGDTVYISHSHFYPGFGQYYVPNQLGWVLSVIFSQDSLQLYPPNFTGPWQKLPTL